MGDKEEESVQEDAGYKFDLYFYLYLYFVVFVSHGQRMTCVGDKDKESVQEDAGYRFYLYSCLYSVFVIHGQRMIYNCV